MARLRFSSAQQVVEAFPCLKQDLSLPTNGDEPFFYIDRLLQSPKQHEALAFCAFLLPRREAVEWLCKSIKTSSQALSEKDGKLLGLAEDWIKTPGETTRQKALSASLNEIKDTASVWAALAAAWSGGSITSNAEHPVPPPNHLTGLAVKLGMRVLLAYLPPTRQTECIMQFTRSAILMLNEDKT